MNIESIKLVLSTWVAIQTALQFIWDDENGPRPLLPYISGHIVIISSTDFGSMKISNTGISTIIHNIEFNLHLQGYGAETEQKLLTLFGSLDNISVQSTFRLSHFCFVKTLMPITNISTLMGNLREKRFAIDLQFRTHMENIHTTDFIETIEITPKYDDVEEVPLQIELT